MYFYVLVWDAPTIPVFVYLQDRARLTDEFDSSIASHAAELVQSMSQHNAQCKRTIVDMNAIPALVNMVKAKDYAEVDQNDASSLSASVALLTLSSGNPGNEIRIRDAGGPYRTHSVRGMIPPGQVKLPAIKLQNSLDMELTIKRTRYRQLRGAENINLKPHDLIF